LGKGFYLEKYLRNAIDIIVCILLIFPQRLTEHTGTQEPIMTQTQATVPTTQAQQAATTTTQVKQSLDWGTGGLVIAHVAIKRKTQPQATQ